MGKLQRYQLVEERPSRIQRFREALDAFRSHWSGPLNASSPEIAKLFNATPVSSGVAVNETTALSYSAVWSAVSLISSQIGNLPLCLYRKLPDGGKEKYESHPLYRLLHDRPNSEMSSLVFRETLQAHVLTWGNGYAEIERNASDRPVALWPITPDRVTPIRRSPGGPLEYRVHQPSGGDTFLSSMDMVHIPGLGFDGITGYGVIQKMRESIGLGLATERFGGSFFGNGATFGGVISYKGPKPTELSDKNYVDALNARHQGVDRAHKLLALYNDATYARLGIPPNEAQFLETRTFQLDEVARWLNVPPHKLKNLLRSTNNNIEHQNLEYYIDCLSQWCNRWEQELWWKLVSPLERNLQDIEHVVEGLLRADTTARGEFHSKQFMVGAISDNEIREVENRNKIPGGDLHAWPLTHIPVNLVEKYYEAVIKEKTAPKPAPPPPGGPTREEYERVIEERDAARRKAQEEEDLRDIALSDTKVAEAQIVALTQQSRETAASATTERDELLAQLRDRAELLATARSEHEAQRRGAETVHGEFRAQIATLTGELEQARLAASGLRHGLEREQTVRAEAEGRAETNATERDALAAAVVTRDAVIVELRAQIVTLTADAETRQTALLEAREALARTQALLEEGQAARRGVDETLAARTALLEQVQRRIAESSVVSRAAVVDDLRWLIEHESDRARRAQASPEKLRTWVTQFYPGHEDRCRKVLRPSVRAWIVCAGHPEPVEHVLDLLVAEYLNQSHRQLRAVADEHDSETMAAGLEKVLRRWEADRAEAVANRVLREVA